MRGSHLMVRFTRATGSSGQASAPSSVGVRLHGELFELGPLFEHVEVRMALSVRFHAA